MVDGLGIVCLYIFILKIIFVSCIYVTNIFHLNFGWPQNFVEILIFAKFVIPPNLMESQYFRL